jgi:Uma2 family endonuclease
MLATPLRLGPADRGRTMNVEEFIDADFAEGYLYELSRGSLIVNEVANPPHFYQVQAIIEQLVVYKVSHPGVIQSLGGSGETRLDINELDSSRHADVVVYKTSAPSNNRDCWAIWVPELAVEVVSPDSRQRDYDEKPDEYLQFGVQEYWVLDADGAEMLVHRRVGGRWKKQIVKPPELHTTHLLPGLQFSCEAVFAAAAK